MKRARLLALTLLAVALLSGCDILEKVPLTPQEAMRAAGKFGLATRERIEETPDGTIYRLMVESRRPANWFEADRAMWADSSTPARMANCTRPWRPNRTTPGPPAAT